MVLSLVETIEFSYYYGDKKILEAIGAALSFVVVVCGLLGLYGINARFGCDCESRLHQLIFTVDCLALTLCVGVVSVSDRGRMSFVDREMDGDGANVYDNRPF